MPVDRHGTLAASQASDTGLTVSGVEEVEHEIDAIAIDQRLRQLTGAGRIGLCIAVQNFDLVSLAALRNSAGQKLARRIQERMRRARRTRRARPIAAL